MSSAAPQTPRLLSRGQLAVLGGLALVPLLDYLLPSVQLSAQMRTVVVFAILGLGLNIVVGWTGLLHLGIAAFMAIGAYAYGILTCEVYPFKGTEGINPLPAPWVPGPVASAEPNAWQQLFEPITSETPVRWFFIYLAILAVVVYLARNLEFSRLGRQLFAVREDELAARCMAIEPDKAKLKAFAMGAALAAVAGALFASGLSSTGEPANYDFQVSILALCIVIVGGIGSITGVLVGAIVMVGLSNVVLPNLTQALQRSGIGSTGSVFASPDNYKYLIFGLALVLMMRYRPDGIVHSRKAVRK